MQLIAALKKMRNDTKRALAEDGFTLPEMVVATAIIVSVVAGFAVFMTGVIGTQRSSLLEKNADRTLAQQIELVNGVTWDNLMRAPAGAYSDCLLDSSRVSTQAVRPGPEKYKTDEEDVSITRTVKWLITNVDVTCGGANADRAEPKIVTITATWNDGDTQRNKTASVTRSRWAEVTPNLTQASASLSNSFMNLVTSDPSAEATTLASPTWQRYNSSIMVRDTSQKRTGASSAKFTSAPTGVSQGSMTMVNGNFAAQNVTASVWVRGTPGAVMIAQGRSNIDGTNYWPVEKQYITLSSTWTRVTVTYAIADGTGSFGIQLRQLNGSNTEDMWVDDAVIVTGSALPF